MLDNIIDVKKKKTVASLAINLQLGVIAS